MNVGGILHQKTYSVTWRRYYIRLDGIDKLVWIYGKEAAASGTCGHKHELGKDIKSHTDLYTFSKIRSTRKLFSRNVGPLAVPTKSVSP